MLDGSGGCGIRPDEGREATLEPKGSGGREKMCCGFTAGDSGHPSHGPEPSRDGCTLDKTQEWGSLGSETLHSGMPRALMPDDGPGGEAESVARPFEPFLVQVAQQRCAVL